MKCQWPGSTRCNRKAVRREWCRPHYTKLRHIGYIEGGMVDPGPAREHIQLCLSRSSDKRTTFATLAGVDHHLVTWILDGTSARIRASTARKILSVPVPPTTIGVIRRLRALSRIGYPREIVARECGIERSNLLSQEYRKKFSSSVAASIVDVYDRRSSTTGPSTRAVGLAERPTAEFPQGYPSPMAWEGIDIDDPDAQPDFGSEVDGEPFDEVVVVEMMAGRMRIPHGSDQVAEGRMFAARREAARRLLCFGLARPEVIGRLGCDGQMVDRIRARMRRDREDAA